MREKENRGPDHSPAHLSQTVSRQLQTFCKSFQAHLLRPPLLTGPLLQYLEEFRTTSGLLAV